MGSREAEVARALRLWGNVTDGLLKARDAWKLFSKVVGEGRLSPELFPIEAQRVFARINPHQDFFVFLERFGEYARRNGGIEEMQVKLTGVETNKSVKSAKEGE